MRHFTAFRELLVWSKPRCMDFPPYFVDHIAGGRLIIGLIASVHVLINHPLAVGAYPLLVFIEWWAHRNNNPALDELARKITFFVFIVTTTVGALTGVGIWLSTSLFAPFAIGSLLRVFFWGWFAEWIVFIVELLLIMAWYLTWNKWRSPEKKRRHIRVGIALAVMSWVTMALIVAVLGFMMTPGEWSQSKAFYDAFMNPLYVPQLVFRTAFAFMTGAVFIWFMSFFFTKGDPESRKWVVERLAHVTLVSLVCLYVAGIWYYSRVPEAMRANESVALLSQDFSLWHRKFQSLLNWTILTFFGIALFGFTAPKLVPRWALLIPTFMGIWLLGHFERTREFMRKPWVIGDYLYANGIHKNELAFLQEEGVLKHATYVQYHEVTELNKIEAGKDVFMLTCSRCHSTTGLNGVVEKFTSMYGNEPWDPKVMFSFVKSMHMTRTFMPPFPGNDAEAEALVAYMQTLQVDPAPLNGAQTDGIRLPAQAQLNGQ